MRRSIILAVVTLALLTTSGVGGQSSETLIDSFFSDFTAEWVRANPNLATSARYFSGDEQDRTVSHWNKLLKGSLVRWLLSASPARPCDLAGFQHPLGYRFDATASALDGPVATVVLRRHA